MSDVLNTSVKPRVSVVIPVYNCLKYLPATLDSVLGQSLQELEILAIDDGSTDGSAEYLRHRAAEEPRLRVLKGGGLGAGGARNLGVEEAGSDLVAFIDADDLWVGDKLARQEIFHRTHPEVVLSFTDYTHRLESSGVDICGCFEYWPEFRKVLEQARDASDNDFCVLTQATARLYQENVVGTSTVMFDRTTFLKVGGFDETLPSASDWDLWLRLSVAGQVAFSPLKSMTYLIRANAISRNQGKRLAAIETILARHEAIASHQDGNCVRLARASFARSLRDFHSQRAERFKALGYALEALCRAPRMSDIKGLAKVFVGRRSIALHG